jgi:arabinoxylan arabinofuranohydrolase
MKKSIAFFIVLTLLFVACSQMKKNNSLLFEINYSKSTNDASIKGGVKYPHHFTYNGNPLSRMHGAADPDANVWGDEIWVYTSQDRTVDSSKHRHHYDAMDGYHAFSTKDMINWTNHGEVFHSSDVSWAWEKGGFLWAPGAARANGKYYLYYPIKNKAGEWRVGVAVGDTPVGPFKDSGKPLEGITDIDPHVFVDDDGQAYIYNNIAIVAKLKPNMIELAETPRKIKYAPDEIMSNDTLKFCEGAYMHKKDGVYYFSYSNWKNKNHQGFYAMGDNPYGPFEWKGAMAPNPKGAQDHHSIIEFKGQSYYFYHISIAELPKYKESQGRIMCFDKLHYNADGTIKMVKHTLSQIAD